MSSTLAGQKTLKIELLIIGGGPGGYSAAFYAADRGKKVAIIERDALGGECLHRGCIPSKAFLHVAQHIEHTRELSACGVVFTEPKIKIKEMVAWKDKIIQQLSSGLTTLAKQRGVQIIPGEAQFLDDHRVKVDDSRGSITEVTFEQAIIATGSYPIRLPGLPDDPRLLDSTTALELPAAGKSLLIIGGGIIGAEMACIYNSLGSEVTVVESTDQLLVGCDLDLVKPLQKRMQSRYKAIHLKTKVTEVVAKKDGLWASLIAEGVDSQLQRFDYVLCAVGRAPAGLLLGVEHAGIRVDSHGFIEVDQQLRTNVSHILAIGDIIGQPMLAHKATHQGHVAAKVALGKKSIFDPRCIPSVAYTDPEVAWVGLTETQAKQEGVKYDKGVFPWAASGRALSMGRTEGFTKLLSDPKTGRILGGGIVGVHAGDLISEVALAIEMGCDVEDIALTIHPHPTTSETVGLSAEMIVGSITDLIAPQHRKKDPSTKEA